MQESIFLIILIVVMALLLLGINFYLLRLYVHKDDKGWTNAIYCKILIILGLTLCQAEALMVPLDVANLSALSKTYLNMAAFWFFMYIIVFGFICILLPYAMFLYETDDEKALLKRLLIALLFTVISLVIALMILLISWNFLKFADIPCQQITLGIDEIYIQSGLVPTPIVKEAILQSETSFFVYVIALLSFFGWILLIIFGGIGLFALPLDMINEFRHRPTARKTQQMNRTREQLVHVIKGLINQGDELEETSLTMKRNSQEAQCWQKFKGKRKVHSGINIFKAKYIEVSQQFDVFNLELKLSNSNPFIPILKLILGIIFLITTILWILQIVFGNILKMYLGDRPLINLLNELLIRLEEGGAGFVGAFIFAYFCLYMLWCVQKGSIKFGMQIPFLCKFHPMKQHETWLNSFLFNVILLLIASVGIIQLCVSSFPTYTRNSQIYMIFGVQIQYMHFYSAIYQSNAFPIAIVGWSIVTLAYLLVTCNRKPKYMKDIEEIRNIK